MTPEYNYAGRMGEPVRACACGAQITREFYADNGNQPARWQTHDAATGFVHECGPSPSAFPPPNEAWWMAQQAPEHAMFDAFGDPSADQPNDDFLHRFKGEL
jgi:hypothetical protein